MADENTDVELRRLAICPLELINPEDTEEEAGLGVPEKVALEELLDIVAFETNDEELADICSVFEELWMLAEEVNKGIDASDGKTVPEGTVLAATERRSVEGSSRGTNMSSSIPQSVMNS